MEFVEIIKLMFLKFLENVNVMVYSKLFVVKIIEPI